MFFLCFIILEVHIESLNGGDDPHVHTKRILAIPFSHVCTKLSPHVHTSKGKGFVAKSDVFIQNGCFVNVTFSAFRDYL